MACADILLNPSATEAFGNVNLEAMAFGLGDQRQRSRSRTLIVDGRTGLLVPVGDIARYAAALARLAANADLRLRLGHAARGASAPISRRRPRRK